MAARASAGARVTALIVEGGAVRGVKAQTSGGEKSYRAKAVVLADGGFEANKDMLKRFVTTHPEHLQMRAPHSGDGDGIRMAEGAGAKLVGMEAFYGHLLSADSLHREGLSPFPFLEFLAATGMMVDANGDRFVDETTGGHFTSNALARHGDGLAHVIFDDAMWNTIGKHFFCPPNPNLVKPAVRCTRPTRSRSLRPRSGLRRAAAPACRRAERKGRCQPREGRGNGRRAQRHAVLRQGQASIAGVPHAAVLRGADLPALTSTLGGIAIDQHGRVLRKDRRNDPGLYAAGSTCGGVEGGPEVGYLGGLIKALVFGVLVAEHHAATKTPKPAVARRKS